MPASLSEILAKRERALRFRYGDGPDESFTVHYRPDKFTKEVEATYLALINESRPAEATDYLVREMVTGWDLNDEFTPENVARLGMVLGARLAEALIDDALGGKLSERRRSAD